MIYVTHDQVEAMTLADTIVVLQAGNIEQVGSPLDLYHHPKNIFVAGFIGSPRMNFVEGGIAEMQAKIAIVKLSSGTSVRVAADPRGARIGDKVTIGIRPEHFVQGNAGVDCITAKVVVVERLGDSTYVFLESNVAKQGLVVRMSADSSVKTGEIISVGLPENACHLFNVDGTAYVRSAVNRK